MQYELCEGLHESKGTMSTALRSSLSERYKEDRNKCRPIPELEVILGHIESGPRYGRNGNFRMGSHRTSLLSVLNKDRQISEFFCNVKKKLCTLLRIKTLRSWDSDS